MKNTATLKELRAALEPYFAGGVWKNDQVPVFQAVGRYLAEEICGSEDLPDFALSREQIRFTVGHRLTVADVGVLAAMGKTSVTVWFKPYVTILATGEELITPFEAPEPGQLRDANSIMLSSLVDLSGAQVVGIDMIREGYEAVEQAIRDAADHSDVVIVTMSHLPGAEDRLLAITDGIRKPGVIAHGPCGDPCRPCGDPCRPCGDPCRACGDPCRACVEADERVILAALKDDYCRCVGRMPALIVCLPGCSAHLARHYGDIVDYFLRKYYFNNL